MGEVLPWIAIVLPAAAAWGGVRVGLNGATRSIVRMESVINRLDEKVDTHGERIAALEVETTNLKERE
jgi:hypothetical protein|tara:strand:+ start:1445 stop:1648 length:204 start_codon:yes stop_codon:yes gene_type:complete